MRLILISLFILLFMSGCATKYQQDSFTGGFSETQLGENIFNVSFKGNGYTSRERASDFALLRCAEIAMNNGYNYFIIVDSEKYSVESTYTTPKTYNTTFQATTYGNHTYGNARTTSSGGQNMNFSSPSANNTILCFKERPQINTVIYEAKFLINSIKSKYDIDN